MAGQDAISASNSGRIGSEKNGPVETVERLTGPDPLTDYAESRMT